MLAKKYFSISEVSKMSNLPTHKLRYIEKTDSNISIVKIRGRRYYTQDNIDYIKIHYSNSSQDHSDVIKGNQNIISQIENLLNKFKQYI